MDSVPTPLQRESHERLLFSLQMTHVTHDDSTPEGRSFKLLSESIKTAAHQEHSSLMHISPFQTLFDFYTLNLVYKSKPGSKMVQDGTPRSCHHIMGHQNENSFTQGIHSLLTPLPQKRMVTSRYAEVLSVFSPSPTSNWVKSYLIQLSRWGVTGFICCTKPRLPVGKIARRQGHPSVRSPIGKVARR